MCDDNNIVIGYIVGFGKLSHPRPQNHPASVRGQWPLVFAQSLIADLNRLHRRGLVERRRGERRAVDAVGADPASRHDDPITGAGTLPLAGAAGDRDR